MPKENNGPKPAWFNVVRAAQAAALWKVMSEDCGASERLVLSHIAQNLDSQINAEGCSSRTLTLSTISKATRLSVSSVQRALKRLEAENLIRRERVTVKSCLHKLLSFSSTPRWGEVLTPFPVKEAAAATAQADSDRKTDAIGDITFNGDTKSKSSEDGFETLYAFIEAFLGDHPTLQLPDPRKEMRTSLLRAIEVAGDALTAMGTLAQLMDGDGHAINKLRESNHLGRYLYKSFPSFLEKARGLWATAVQDDLLYLKGGRVHGKMLVNGQVYRRYAVEARLRNELGDALEICEWVSLRLDEDEDDYGALVIEISHDYWRDWCRAHPQEAEEFDREFCLDGVVDSDDDGEDFGDDDGEDFGDDDGEDDADSAALGES